MNRRGSKLAEVDTGAYRKVLAQFPTGVAVMTVLLADGRPLGITINSFSSVSLSPPVILWSISRSTPSYSAFAGATHFAVNFLAEGQKDLSTKFSRPSEDKFSGVEWASGLDGVPILVGCTAYMECSLRERIVVGDHDIILGDVLGFSSTDKQPLVYALSDYKRLARVIV